MDVSSSIPDYDVLIRVSGTSQFIKAVIFAVAVTGFQCLVASYLTHKGIEWAIAGIVTPIVFTFVAAVILIFVRGATNANPS